MPTVRDRLYDLGTDLAISAGSGLFAASIAPEQSINDKHLAPLALGTSVLYFVGLQVYRFTDIGHPQEQE